MHSKLYLSPLAASMLLTMAASAQAAQPIVLNKTSFQNVHKQFDLALPGTKQSALVSPDSLKYLKQHTDLNNVTHIRMQQMYKGYLVYGGYAIMHSNQPAKTLLSAQNVTMNGVIYSDLQNELGNPSADFVKNASVALNQFTKPYQSMNPSEEQVTPLVFIDKQHQAHWAYKVSVLIQANDKMIEKPTAIIDAVTYKPFVQWNDLKTASKKDDVKGKGYGGNQKMGMYTFGEETYPLLQLTRNPKLKKCFMETTDVKVIDMDHKYSSKSNAMKFSCASDDPKNDTFWTGYSQDGYDKINGAFSPSNDALYAGYVINHMYSDWYGIPALVNQDGTPMQLVMRVHYGERYENAFWNGSVMTFGDGDTMIYPLVSLGVGAHEISHGFTEQHSDLAYFAQSGGMNESFSDMAAQAAEYYSVGKNSWQIGPEIMKEDSGYEALRYMDEPSKDGSSIDSADEYDDDLDVHYSSGVYNRLFYLIANTPNWNTRKAFDVMVKANTDYWTMYSTFEEGGCGILKATKDLGYSVEDVQEALSLVAIEYDSCEDDLK